MMRTSAFAMATVLLPVLLGCVSTKAHETAVARLEQGLADLGTQLDAERRRSAVLEEQVARLDAVSRAVATLETEHQAVSGRLDTVRGELRTSTTRLDEVLGDVAALRKEAASRQELLQEQRTRFDELQAALHRYETETPGQVLFQLEKRLADLTGQVELNQRMGQSNADRVAEMEAILQRLVAQFNQQMTLLERYINEQFVPIAEGLANHLYTETKRMNAAAAELDDLAKDIDPYKFRHLIPAVEEESAEPKHASGDDG
jgi:chromosome segregation ATPase